MRRAPAEGGSGRAHNPQTAFWRCDHWRRNPKLVALPLPSAEVLKNIVEYVPTGDLRWLQRGHAAFDSTFAGKLVGKNTNQKGYRKLLILGRNVYAHRVIWKIFYDTEPEFVDHINSVRDDNRIENLREAKGAENNRHVRRHGGLSNYKGVYGTRNVNWGARIKINGKTIHLGTFSSELEAALAYDNAAILLHGDFCFTNQKLGLI